MWFTKTVGQTGNGVRLALITDLTCQDIYPTVFFHHFNNARVFTIYDLELNTLLNEAQDFEEVLGNLMEGEIDVIQEAEEVGEGVPSA